MIGPFEVTRRPLDEVVRELTSEGHRVVRDNIIDSAPEGNLVAVDGDFWFHTDGTFLLKPPRIIVIEVIYVDTGGALSVLDLEPLASAFAQTRVRFDDGGAGLEVSLAEEIGGVRCIRYRRDRMEALDGTLEGTHRLIEAVGTDAEELGALPIGSVLVLDNWRMAHRRRAFIGRRRIRRVWLD